jgi:mitochondrial chaperone BCS1
MKKDERKTVIYRGTTKSGSTEPTWQRCMARTSRPFSTVILNEKLKKDLIDDVTDYLNPNTRRWYANRGIPYRRGYLLYGPPGTGKSSLSLALAGFFKMRIYIVSLSSITASEENLASLFAELPRRCVVLLEDIDTAGLTHTREANGQPPVAVANDDMVPGQTSTGNGNTNTTPVTGRLSLSGLLNILDGVASQEGRVLIMTTNHLDKLDKALIRPGRVDMTVKFDRADGGMISAIFRAIFAELEGDEAPKDLASSVSSPMSAEAEKRRMAEEEKNKAERNARVEALSYEFETKIPAHEFSPAEIQGYLLKYKRDPDFVVSNAENWVLETRKEKKEAELKEAEEKRLAEKKRQEEEENKKKEEENKKKVEAEENKKKEEEEKSKKAEEKKKEKEKDNEEAKKKGAEGGVKEEEQEKADKTKTAKPEDPSDSADSTGSWSDTEAEARKIEA